MAAYSKNLHLSVYHYRSKLLKATTCAIALVKESRQKYAQLNGNICSMIELVLMLIGKVFAMNDEEILSLMNTEWKLNDFVHELIIALTNGVAFGGSGNDHAKEIKVSVYKEIKVSVYKNLCWIYLTKYMYKSKT